MERAMRSMRVTFALAAVLAFGSTAATAASR